MVRHYAAHDLALVYRPQFAGKSRHEYLAGVLGVRNTVNGRITLQTWDDLVRNRTDQWADQETLPALYKFCQSAGISVWRMGQEVLSADSGNMDAYLWGRNWHLGLDQRLADNIKLLLR